jgi:hypothetical protein
LYGELVLGAGEVVRGEVQNAERGRDEVQKVSALELRPP